MLVGKVADREQQFVGLLRAQYQPIARALAAWLDLQFRQLAALHADMAGHVDYLAAVHVVVPVLVLGVTADRVVREDDADAGQRLVALPIRADRKSVV